MTATLYGFTSRARLQATAPGDALPFDWSHIETERNAYHQARRLAADYPRATVDLLVRDPWPLWSPGRYRYHAGTFTPIHILEEPPTCPPAP